MIITAVTTALHPQLDTTLFYSTIMHPIQVRFLHFLRIHMHRRFMIRISPLPKMTTPNGSRTLWT
jgi:hypothetical protein